MSPLLILNIYDVSFWVIQICIGDHREQRQSMFAAYPLSKLQLARMGPSVILTGPKKFSMSRIYDYLIIIY